MASCPSRRVARLIAGIFIYMGMIAYVFADNDGKSNSDSEWLNSILGIPSAANIRASDQEIQSLGCIIVGSSVAIVAIILGSTAIIASGSQSVAIVTEIAIPVLAAATMAGCVIGGSSALGFAWISRNKEKLFGKIVDVIPAGMEIKILPQPPSPIQPPP
ncbi:membrane hypothetical protein [Gammaproteobacteria bacterium]